MKSITHFVISVSVLNIGLSRILIGVNMLLTTGNFHDWLGLTMLLSCWIGYTCYSRSRSRYSASLSSVLAQYREEWMIRVIARENRTSDASLISSLRASVSFFASTSILVVAGLITGIAASEQAVSVISTIPFVRTTTQELWELKMLVMITIFIYSFFEFTWSLRLYNFVCIVMGNAPFPKEVAGNENEQSEYGKTAGNIMTLAASHFNFGLRAYYFALGTLSWFIDPRLWMGITIFVTIILYSREFHSKALSILVGYNLPPKLS
ncbi:MAG: DUF599 domain-containing protein [Endozoicomonas sp.]